MCLTAYFVLLRVIQYISPVTLVYDEGSSIYKVINSPNMHPPAATVTSLSAARDGPGRLVGKVRLEVLHVAPMQGSGRKKNLRIQVGT